MSEETQEKKWLYSDTATRFAKSNQIMRLCINIMEIFLLVLFLMQITLTTTADYLVIGVPTVLYLVGLIANNVIYMKDSSAKKFRYTAIPVYLLAWAWLCIFSPNAYVVMYILPVLFCLIIYSDAKLSVIVAVSSGVIMLIRVVKGFMELGYDGMGSEVPFILLIVMSAVFFGVIARHHRIYEKHMSARPW